MKAQILKIAGVKSEKEFYKKYPSEEAFMKQHGKAFKKAQMGTMISGGDKMSNPKMLNLQNLYDEADMDVTGMTDEMRQKQLAALQASQAAQTPTPSKGGGGDALGSIMGMLGGSGGAGGEEGGGLMSMLGGEGGEEGGIGAIMGMLGGGARYGADIPRAQVGANMPSWYQDNQTGFQSNFQQPYYGPASQQPVQSVGSLQPAGNTPSGQNLNQLNPLPTAQQLNAKPGQEEGIMDTIAKKAGPVGQLYGSYQALRGERRARKAAEQQKAVSDITLKASQTRPEEIKRKYVRPEDIQNTGEEFFPIYGVGTNPLARNGIRLQDGGGIGGNPTEIQNTYGNDNSIYDDLEYEPLYNVNKQKSFYHGGRLHSMQDGGGTPWGQIGELGSQVASQASGGPNAGGDIGGQLGGTLGEVAGNAIAPGVGGPIGKAIGQVGGTLAGGFLDTNPKSIKRNQAATQRNIQMMALNSGFQGVQSQNQSYVRNGGDIPNYEDGGYMNPEYNPQVITMFGDHNAQDFADYAHKDQYRAGGHLKSYTPPSERAMETYRDGGGVKSYGLGGELQTHWGGGAETLSHNPYLPGTGETVMFRGKSHEEYSPNGETGIGVTYGGNPVEVERGEPMVELEEGGTIDPQTGEVQKSGVVFGNLKIPDAYLPMLGDKSAKGQKFKNYVADLSKGEEKQNKLIEKSTNELNGFTPLTSFDKLKMTALQANIQGANMKLKDIADKKINAAALQNAINDTAEEHGIVADDLARGKIKIDKEAMEGYAKFGGSFNKAQKGKTVKGRGDKWSFTPAGDTGNPVWDDAKRYEQEWTPSVKKALTDKERATKMLDYINSSYGNESEKVKKSLNKFNTEDEKINFLMTQGTNKEVGPIHHVIDAAIKYTAPGMTTPLKEQVKEEKKPTPKTTPIPYKRNKWIDLGNQALEYLRPSDQEALDMEQLYPEMYAMSSNQLEPVPAQGYQPDLGVPYDISLQDQLNANQADYRSMQRMVGYNPAAQANLNAQKYQANQGVLGDQFRANQAMKDKVYGENRQILNQAKLTNLGIYDKQYERQAQALSNTKATTQAALNSIADKYAKNKLENRTLGVMENMYKYRYDKSGRAINMNPLFQPTIPTVGSTTNTQKQVPIYKADGKTIDHYQLEEMTPEEITAQQDEDSQIVPLSPAPAISPNVSKKAKKEKRNGSIVRSYKNI